MRVWDERAGSESVRVYKAHEAWCARTSFSNVSENLFASSGYDGKARVWDLRCAEAMHTLKTENEKVFALDWNGSAQLLSGGDAGQILIHGVN